ncbi:MAG: response regulator [Ardenticatenaceae bacterium]|nr:response regulator [Anaerolineales bacterium]MCB8982592.1 response regulator [Ardenticatenaceae bacterium]
MTTENSPRILIVDDDLIVRETFSELLALEGYKVATACDGLEALTTVPQFLPDVILLDVMMPVVDGYTVCRRLKNSAEWQHIPIILVTALDGRSDLIRGLDAGADEFLSKPIDRGELRARLRTMLRIKRQYDSLQEDLKMREDMINMAVHDIRSPLTAVMMHCGLLSLTGKNLTPNQQHSIEAIRSQTQQINAFANDLLVLAKSESGQLTLKKVETFIAELIERLQEQYTLMAETLDVTLQTDIEPQRKPVVLDPSLFTRTIDNLLSNALKFSSAGEKVTLRVRFPNGSSGGPQLRVEVADEGPGVPLAYRESIFDKYKTLDAKREGVSQTGLGLAFCKMCIDAHKGRIFVTDNQPKGSVFVVEI